MNKKTRKTLDTIREHLKAGEPFDPVELDEEDLKAIILDAVGGAQLAEEYVKGDPLGKVLWIHNTGDDLDLPVLAVVGLRKMQ